MTPLDTLEVVESRFGLSIKAVDREEVAYVNKTGTHEQSAELRKLAYQMAAGPQLCRALTQLIALASQAVTHLVKNDDPMLQSHQVNVIEAHKLLERLREAGAA